MPFAPLSTLITVPASIPSPSVSYLQIGPLTIHFYALCIIAGIIVAALIANHRLTKRGAEKWIVIDIAIPAIVLGIIGARIFHVLTHPDFYFGPGKNTWNPFEQGSVWAIWEGGIAIFGALMGGAVGAWLGCRWTGIRFWTFADALAPGLLLAQAMGRFGNWFNHELFGLPTDLPWGLEIESTNPAFPPGLAEGTLFHPTFLYEVLWNGLGVIVLLWAGSKLKLQWGKLFALYLIWYSAGRIVWESIRIDPSEVLFGLRSNVWAAIFGVLVGLVIMIVQTRRHPGVEPSPYVPGRVPAEADVDSQDNPSDFVDVSEPPAKTEVD
ncbi:prolipoprotein diacylglyceryl transferase [Microbacterium esteraromaticum]|uniref:Phosphatidylglycerol--prolipoprotein diacylglyceryl transferase n=1 Tax=Microbacterium esteraromaticum TaxID=57043 RepID=A0A939DWE1_9MICO|nr:prolipoprotein diacylglyceryl transferase [Microbacterium esteraromaticum]MBN7792602.1 prolipoprotein diacylglyceryl transferase [Microbacterium esteraromaticum]MBN8206131.1 prolipoprotein diacylglyceryl transferase [Microbacterium esteraromaticum]MBN8416286.1 prolipoprotein diacylglyceryl transferase [Microbacterium esteraromaticum]MBN8423359.1 prolipoprotein diacylglyceryl transferase [Microbacterium esteraromaticum]MCA1306289.1 prolipoprotein diacylglyceryl transferase [Microbacterium es